MEGYCSTGQIPPWAVVPVEEEEESIISAALVSCETWYHSVKESG
jgi:hypothetical protein